MGCRFGWQSRRGRWRTVPRRQALIDGIEADYLLADRGYDTNQVLAAARAHGDGAGDPAEAESEVAAGV